MAYPTYPRGLPYIPEGTDYVEPNEPIIEETEFEFGNARQRLKRSVPLRPRPYRLGLTQKQKEEFYDFWLNNLSQGTSRFRMRVLGPKGRWELHEVQIAKGKVDFLFVGWKGGERFWHAVFTLRVFHMIDRDEEGT